MQIFTHGYLAIKFHRQNFVLPDLSFNMFFFIDTIQGGQKQINRRFLTETAEPTAVLRFYLMYPVNLLVIYVFFAN